MTARALAVIAALLATTVRASDGPLPATASPALPIAAVETIGVTVSSLDRATAFYTGVLRFEKVSDQELSGRPFELLSGVFGARARMARLRLGSELLELTEYLAPRGRPIPDDLRPNDHAFQHAAIVVADIDRAYDVLRRHDVEHASTAPQRLPDWNPNAGGISAFYFRDPDRHFLEVIAFPPGKGDPRWQEADGRLFLGIDHTAIVVDDTNRSLRFYRDVLGMEVAGESENYDVEQEHLNNVFGARLRITALRAAGGPGIELLEYLAPRDGRPAPPDRRANDVGHWETTAIAERLDPLIPLAREHRVSLVSPGPIDVTSTGTGFRQAALTRDPDGHGIRIVSR